MSPTQGTAAYHARTTMKHEKAAESHDRAAAEHRSAARSHVAGDHSKAREHARNAKFHGEQAQDLCVRATEREGYENQQFGVHAKRMYLHHRHSLRR